MKTKNFSLIFFFSTLALASLACSVFVGGPDYPASPVAVSTGEVGSMQTQVAKALLDGADSGVVSFQITETQLTSLVALKMAAMENPPFTDPQVTLRDNQMKVYGKMKSGAFAANVLIVINVSVDTETNSPKIEIASADFGPLPAPEGLNSAISKMVGEAFTGSMGPVATGFRLESISIADGIMTIAGRIK